MKALYLIWTATFLHTLHLPRQVIIISLRFVRKTVRLIVDDHLLPLIDWKQKLKVGLRIILPVRESTEDC